jgi:glycosyltransferase involved in cell wall biosynthesis
LSLNSVLPFVYETSIVMKWDQGMRVQLIAKPGPGMTGTSRYTTELHRALQGAGADVYLAFPARAPVPKPVQSGLKHLGLDLQTFFASYPLRVPPAAAGVYHVTAQTLATLLLFQRFPGPVMVTVLDIIPYLVRHSKDLNTSKHVFDRFFYQLALAGLLRADALIAISDYTKRTLVEALRLPAERIHVVPLAVNHECFRPAAVPDAFRARYGLGQGYQYLLYVGSDDPRKNFRTLIRAFAQLHKDHPDIRLLKVGAETIASERRKTASLIGDLSLQERVMFFDAVPDEVLPLFYNAAEIFVLPSLYEGFGLPVLEAMACGTPVVCSNAASLPEVVGDAALLADPRSVEGFAEAIAALMGDEALRQSQRHKGLARAAQFTWRRVAEETARVYSTTLEERARTQNGG